MYLIDPVLVPSSRGLASGSRRLSSSSSSRSNRRRRSCGNCGKPTATRRRRAVFQAAVGNRPRPAEGGRFSKAVVGGRREGRHGRPKAGRAFRGPSTSAGRRGSFHGSPRTAGTVQTGAAQHFADEQGPARPPDVPIRADHLTMPRILHLRHPVWIGSRRRPVQLGGRATGDRRYCLPAAIPSALPVKRPSSLGLFCGRSRRS